MEGTSLKAPRRGALLSKASELKKISSAEAEVVALLQAISTRDGKTLAQYRLDALPVYDGMALAYGRLFLSLKNGQVLCMRSK